MSKIRRGSLIDAAALLVTLVVNGMANALPINGLTTGQVSDSFDVFFVPAAYVFSIWGLIYVALIAFVTYEIVKGPEVSRRVLRIRTAFRVSCLANALWLVLWHYQLFAASVVAMIVLLVALIFAYLRLGIGSSDALPGERWFVRLPFSLYLGWITVATIANITAFLASRGWAGWGLYPQTWAAIMIGIAWVVTAVVAVRHGDVAYGCVLLWALSGIAARFPTETLVRTSALVACGLIACTYIVALARRARAAT